MASAGDVSTGYNKAWFRDNIYEAIGLEAMEDWVRVQQVYSALLNILNKHIGKIQWAIDNRPVEEWQYIHARYHPDTLNEFWDSWGNAQNDMVGLFLLKVGELHRIGHSVIRDSADLNTIQLLVYYLRGVHYYEDFDNGMWEENREVHSSSVGNCVAGLRSVGNLVEVPEWLIQKGQDTLNDLLPRESATKRCDLAQLSLIWPCNVVNEDQKALILNNIETILLREKGVIRYEGDSYYNLRTSPLENPFDKEAEWTFGLPWLAKIYSDHPTKYQEYLDWALSVRTPQGEMPELYLADGTPNENTPLGWAEAILICAIKAKS